MNILVIVDGSRASRAAIDEACAFAERNPGSSCKLIFIPRRTGWMFNTHVALDSDPEKLVQDEAAELSAQMAAQFPDDVHLTREIRQESRTTILDREVSTGFDPVIFGLTSHPIWRFRLALRRFISKRRFRAIEQEASESH